MKLLLAILTALFLFPGVVLAQTMQPPMSFGTPPTGSVPILFNDHHVYAKPTDLKQGRVLAALVRGGSILVPLRSMFEEMGQPFPTIRRAKPPMLPNRAPT